MSAFVHPLQDLYDRIPDVHCKGHCGADKHDHCCGPIGCTVTEAVILDMHDGIESEWVSIRPGEVLMDIEAMMQRHELKCPHLGHNGRCTAYEARPMICRLWAANECMKCPWGCRPERYLTAMETARLLHEARMRCLREPHPAHQSAPRGHGAPNLAFCEPEHPGKSAFPIGNIGFPTAKKAAISGVSAEKNCEPPT